MSELLPANLGAERYVLGSVLMDPAGMHGLRSTVGRDHFSLERHARVWDAMCTLYDSGAAVERVSIYSELARRGWAASDELGFVSGLDAGLPQLYGLESWVGILAEKASLRRLIRTAGLMIQRAESGHERAQEIIESFSQSILDAAPEESGKDPSSIHEVFNKFGMQQILAPRRDKGVALPWRGLNNLLCGLHPGQMVLLAAHTGEGKTSMALQIAIHAARHGTGVVFFTREMEKPRLSRRAVNQLARIDADKQRHGALTAEERERQAQAAAELDAAPLYMDEQSATTPAICAAIRKTELQHGVGLVVVDYLQLLRSVGRFESRAKEVGANSRALKQAAMELGLPILVLCQFSRDSAKANRPPELYDLKESGDIENDSDTVLLIRPEKPKPEDSTLPVPVIVHVAKQREGPHGENCKLFFFSKYQTFEESSTAEE